MFSPLKEDLSPSEVKFTYGLFRDLCSMASLWVCMSIMHKGGKFGRKKSLDLSLFTANMT